MSDSVLVFSGADLREGSFLRRTNKALLLLLLLLLLLSRIYTRGNEDGWGFGLGGKIVSGVGGWWGRELA